MNDRSSYFVSAFYFLAGALAGAGVALLVAPQAGEVTRQIMRRKLHDSGDSARRLKDRVVRRGEEIGEQAAQRVADAASALAARGSRETRGQGDEVVPA